MPRTSSQPARLTNRQSIDTAICDAFSDIYNLDCDRREAISEHVKPVVDKINKDWKALSAQTGYAITDVKDQYRIYRRMRDAEAFEEDADREKVKDAQKGIFAALVRGQIMKFQVGAAEYTPAGVANQNAMQTAGGGETEAAGAVLAAGTKH